MKTKNKRCEYCDDVFEAKLEHSASYKKYCPACVKKRVWFSKFKFGGKKV